MRVLALESSCDETSAAVVQVDPGPVGANWRPVVEGHYVASQVDLHKRYGGVVPELASRAHLEAVLPAVGYAMDEAKVERADIDFIAVTKGPGLVGALLMGVETAKSLSFSWGIPLLGVHHLAGHIMAVYLDENPPELPFLCLLVSGGHSAIYHVHSPTQYELLGQTRDDAAGEAFDKGARMLGLPYPGGAEIDRLSSNGDTAAYTFPIGMKHSGDLDMSFSGLKTSLRQTVQKLDLPLDDTNMANICASYQEAIAQALARKTCLALEQTGLSRLVVCGGVARNRRIRSLVTESAQAMDVAVHLVPFEYCTDNAAMIAVAALAAPNSSWLASGSPEAMSLDADPAFRITTPFGTNYSV
ncbi:MAG: tRNA (adenosine(37)-N6)-threonylcarbamoyltransferase complex transferase subunit TsaD [Myxococcales bacterium]|nr:tRNA (adenosine(37)-N6)-threonylcarbamoyltransferase complex transferase subunit TsaD [Myxococcales bacterium]